MNAYELANLADVTSPDSLESPGAEWLQCVYRAASEAIEYGADEDTVHELADSVVPVYTHERWRVFVDLAAYGEDLDELGGMPDDLTEAAGVALYLIASRLIGSLIESADDESEEE